MYIEHVFSWTSNPCSCLWSAMYSCGITNKVAWTLVRYRINAALFILIHISTFWFPLGHGSYTNNNISDRKIDSHIDRNDQMRQRFLLEELCRAAASWGYILIRVIRNVDVMRNMLLANHDDIPKRNTTRRTHPLMHLLDISKTSLT